jgi:transposase
MELACLAHARRYFVRARDSDPTLTDAAIERIGQLYAVERVAKLRELSADGRCELRRSMAKPALKPWLELTRTQVPDKRPMAKAIHYALSNWEALTRYVEDGRLNIDNLPAERALCAVAVGRKNWMMIGNERGGNAAPCSTRWSRRAKRSTSCRRPTCATCYCASVTNPT